MHQVTAKIYQWPQVFEILSMLLLAILLLMLLSINAKADPSKQCDLAAQHAAHATGVPLDILRTISIAGTGRKERSKMVPWPWTVNVEGRGIWFDTEAQAISNILRHFKSGKRNFDIGCFQINYRWHGHAFRSIEEMFEPMANTRYAALFIRRLHREFGDWDRAIGAFHSRTHKHAQRYLERYSEVRRSLEGQSSEIAQTKEKSALFQGKVISRSRGSLVPLAHSPLRKILK